jgi:hypothetical protein
LIFFFNEPLVDPWASNNINSNNVWHGKWFPHAPGVPDDQNPTVEIGKKNLYDSEHEIVMGVKNPNCDDGKVDGLTANKYKTLLLFF